MSSNLTHKQAIDEIQVMAWAVWEPTGFKMFWEAVRDVRDTTEVEWASTYIRHGPSRQVTLGPVGARLFERRGTIIMNCFAPIGKGLSESYASATILADAFEGKSSPGGVWFTDVKIKEIGREGQFYQVNALADFTYNQIK